MEEIIQEYYELIQLTKIFEKNIIQVYVKRQNQKNTGRDYW